MCTAFYCALMDARAEARARYSLRLLGRFSLGGLLRRGDRARGLDLGEFLRRIAEHLGQDFLGVLAEQRRALHFGDRVRQLDWVSDGQVLAAGRMIDLNDRAG